MNAARQLDDGLVGLGTGAGESRCGTGRRWRPLASRGPGIPGRRCAVERAYFQALHAAEQAAWMASGGDYVRSARRS